MMNNPFKMKWPWIGAIGYPALLFAMSALQLTSIVNVLSLPVYPLIYVFMNVFKPSYFCAGPDIGCAIFAGISIAILLMAITGFLIGWVIEAKFIKKKKR